MTNSLAEKEIIIRERIKSAFLDETELTEREAWDLGFHMTDWLKDLIEIQTLYSNIENLSSGEICSFMYGFLAHVPNHLNAAKKLSGMGKTEDIFNANIFEDE